MRKFVFAAFAVTAAVIFAGCCSTFDAIEVADQPVSAEQLKKSGIVAAYPGWKLKALSFSYDDGHYADRQLVKVFDKYGVKATFNIPSGLFGKPKPGNMVDPSEVKTLYANHEVAGHGAHHINLPRKKPELVSSELDGDIQKLPELTGKKLLGYAYPYGRFSDMVVNIMRPKGLLYARTCKMAGNFDLPQDFLMWHPYCHHNRVKGLAKKFLDYKAEKMSVLIVWGHSYEFIARRNRKTGQMFKPSWHVIENFCKEISGKPELWYATMGEIATYVKATEKLTASKCGNFLKNNSELPVYLLVNGKKYQIEPGKTVRVK